MSGDGAVDTSESGWWPASVREVLRWHFPRSPVGRRGLHEEVVEEFRDYVAGALEHADRERASLLAEIDRLHAYIREQWANGAATGPEQDPLAATPAESVNGHRHAEVRRRDGLLDDPSSPAGQALEVLARAQALADQRMAQAQERLDGAERMVEDAESRLDRAEKRAGLAMDQARRSITEADDAIQERWERADREIAARRAAADAEIDHRLGAVEEEAFAVIERAWNQYEEILARAHRRSEYAAQRALEDYHDESAVELFGPGVRAELEMKAAYMRTFGRVSAAALRATMDAVRQEFQRITGPVIRHEESLDLPAYRISATGDLVRVEVTAQDCNGVDAVPVTLLSAPSRPAIPAIKGPAIKGRVQSLPAAFSAR